MIARRVFILGLVFTLFVSGFRVTGRAKAQPGASSLDSSVVAKVIEKYRQQIPEQMQKQRIPGFSIALVTADQVLWAEGFGYTDWDRRIKVSPDTPFSIQSMSKSFTALGVLLAVQEGLVDLDTPISQYLPDFHINSIFEAQPEQKITLRHLLSHTAGFTHEAPVGNNYDSFSGTFDEHAATIQDTWLKFPVGQMYGYSNLGIDLAAYVVEAKAGMPFQDYVQKKLLEPLGMSSTSMDIAAIRGMASRAIGHASVFKTLPLVAMMPSGGVYSSVNDMARYLQFHLKRGKAGEQTVLAEKWIDEMYTPQYPATLAEGYGLGVGVAQRNGTLMIAHGGGGFGFLSMMTWYPELNVGLVWLSNSSEHDLQDWLSDQILGEIIQGSPGLWKDRLPSIPWKAFGPEAPSTLSTAAQQALIDAAALPVTQESLSRWKSYAGKYSASNWGMVSELHDLSIKANQLYFDEERLAEVQPGLFFNAAGEAVDLRGLTPTFRNIHMVKIPAGKVVLYYGFFFVFGLFFLGMVLRPLGLGLYRLARRLLRRTEVQAPASKSERWLGRISRISLWLAALLGLLTLVGLVVYPVLLVGRMPLPTPNLTGGLKVYLSLPYAILALAAIAGLLTGLGWKRIGGQRALDLATAGLVVVFVVVLLI